MKEPDRSRVALDAMIRSVLEGASLATFMTMMQTWCSTQAAFEGKSAAPSVEVNMDPSPIRVIEGFARQKQALDSFDTRNRANEIRVRLWWSTAPTTSWFLPLSARISPHKFLARNSAG